MIQLYHLMDSIVTSLLRRGGVLWKTLAGSGAPASVQRGGAHLLPAYAALARYHLSTTDLEPRLRLMVTQLAAERSRCRWCIERGRHLWREAQLSMDALRALLCYETSSLFSNRERAALRFTDAVTRYSEADGAAGMLAPLTAARQHLSEPEIAAVTAAVAASHFFNPITGALGADAEAPWGSFWL